MVVGGLLDPTQLFKLMTKRGLGLLQRKFRDFYDAGPNRCVLRRARIIPMDSRLPKHTHNGVSSLWIRLERRDNVIANKVSCVSRGAPDVDAHGHFYARAS